MRKFSSELFFGMKNPPTAFPVDFHSARNGYLTPNAKAVMLVYRSYTDVRGESYPSKELIRQHTRLSVPTIRKCITELEDHHILTFLRKAVKGKRGDVYRVLEARQISTSTYLKEEGEFNSPEPSCLGLSSSQYAAVKDRFIAETQEFEDVEF